MLHYAAVWIDIRSIATLHLWHRGAARRHTRPPISVLIGARDRAAPVATFPCDLFAACCVKKRSPWQNRRTTPPEWESTQKNCSEKHFLLRATRATAAFWQQDMFPGHATWHLNIICHWLVYSVWLLCVLFCSQSVYVSLYILTLLLTFRWWWKYPEIFSSLQYFPDLTALNWRNYI